MDAQPSRVLAAGAPPGGPTFDVGAGGPPVPETLADTGLSAGFVADLLLRALHTRGATSGGDLAGIVCLPFTVLDDILMVLQQRRMVEVRGTAGHARSAYVFDLSHLGTERALASMAATQYVGPAPVTLKAYEAGVARQSVHNVHLTRDAIHAGFRGLVVTPTFLDRLGPAINSARSLFLWGDAGNGKTLIAETIAALLGGAVYVPHAVLVDGQIIMVYDPVHHHPPVEDEGRDAVAPGDSLWRADAPTFDRRYVRCRRPTVITGGELTFEQLELRHDPVSRVYQAPVQVKANNGVLILDDFGRQRVEPRALLNRWMIPLEQRRDYLALHTGTKFTMPFDCLLVFATNLDPAELVEEAFLRRIRYKIEVKGPDRGQYAEMLRRCCDERGIVFDPTAVDHLYARYYGTQGLEPRACHPRDVADHVCDVARYYGRERSLERSMLDRACESYFLMEAG